MHPPPLWTPCDDGEPSHGDSRWATVRYALSSNARTARLCLILLVMTGVPGVLLAVVLHHARLRRAGPVLRVLMPTHGGTRCRLRRPHPLLAVYPTLQHALTGRSSIPLGKPPASPAATISPGAALTIRTYDGEGE